MLDLTAHHFEFADKLTRATPVFRQSLVVHSCMHLRQQISTFKNSTPELIWARILAGIYPAFLDEVQDALLFEMVRHASQLIAHDNPNIIIGAYNGARAMILSEGETLRLIEKKQIFITNDAATLWIFLLIKEGMSENYATSIVKQWIKHNAHAN